MVCDHLREIPEERDTVPRIVGWQKAKEQEKHFTAPIAIADCYLLACPAHISSQGLVWLVNMLGKRGGQSPLYTCNNDFDGNPDGRAPASFDDAMRGMYGRSSSLDTAERLIKNQSEGNLCASFTAPGTEGTMCKVSIRQGQRRT